MDRSEKNIEKGKDLFDRFIAIAALVAGIGALLFSWQANQFAREANRIAERQLTPQLTLLHVRPSGWEYITGNATQVGCDHTLRVYNFGGAPAVISEQLTELHFDGKTSNLLSVSSFAGASHTLTSADLNLAESTFLTVDTQLEQRNDPAPEWRYFTPTDLIRFPMQIDEFAAEELVNRTTFILSGLPDIRDYTYGDPQFSYMTDLERFLPVEITVR